MASNIHNKDDAFEPDTAGDAEMSFVGDRRNILLLGDDGGMADLLRQVPGDGRKYHLHNETDILEGISMSGRGDYQLILLNAKRLGYKTTEAVAALRQTSPSATLVLYGPAYAEIYAHSALKKGADDYLTWPIPAAEIKRYLMDNHSAAGDKTDRLGKTVLHPTRSAGNGDTSQRQRRDTTAQLFSQDQWLVHYHRLAQLVPHGYAVLVEQTEKLLSELLCVDWVKIESADKDDNTWSKTGDSDYSHIPLNGPTGPVGHMKLGPAATDAIDVSPEQLAIAANQISGFIGTILHLALRDEQLKQLAIVDELTGAYNRRYLEYFMRQVITQSAHEQTEVTLLLFDIDEFKHYNDTYGHAAGDEILRQTTNLTRRCCREHDVVARIGGDEFAVLFWDTGRQRDIFPRNGQGNVTTADTQVDTPAQSHSAMVMFMSNRFRRMMTTNEFPGLGPEARGVLTVSGGLARFPSDGRTVEELLAQADQALLKAKRSGKNRIYLVGRPQ